MIHLLIFACFFLSGAAALAYEVVCSRLFVQVFGSALYATATVLAVFMGGLSGGALVAGRRADRLADPLATYAWLEAGIGLSGLLLLVVFSGHLLSDLWAALRLGCGGEPWAVTGGRILVCAAALAVPAALMGATLPVLARYVAATGAGLARSVSCLYLVNTGGAVAGTVCSGFLLVPRLGLCSTLAAAAGTNLLIAAAAAACRMRHGERGGGKRAGEGGGEKPAESSAETGVPALPAVAAMLFMVGLCGALSMILEVAWTRFFALIFQSSTYAFSTMLAVFLSGLSAGAAAGTALSGRRAAVLPTMAALLALSGAYLYGSLFFLGCLPSWFSAIARAFAGAGAVTFEAALCARGIVSALVMLPPTVALGAIFPLAVGLVVQRRQTAARAAGRLYSASTAGCIAGSLAGGFLFIPWLSNHFTSGVQMVLSVVAAAQLALSVILLLVPRRACPVAGRRRAAAFLAVMAGGGGLALLAARLPPWEPAAVSGSPGGSTIAPAHIVYYREGLNSTITVGEVPGANIRYLASDGRVQASVPLDPAKPAPASDLSTQLLLGLLPLLLHDGPVQDALLIGYGSGTTCGAMLSGQGRYRLTVAELEEAVLGAGPYFQEVNGASHYYEWLTSGRLRWLPEDGRLVLAACPQQFDAIVSQPSEPWMVGSAGLFTDEFWHLSKRRLRPGGIFCQWVQLYGLTPGELGVVCRTFLSSYPESLAIHQAGSGEIMLLGWNGGPAPDPARLARAAPAQGIIWRRLQAAGVSGPAALASMVIAGPAELRRFCDDVGRHGGDDGRLNTDDNLLLEYELPRALFGTTDEALIEGNLRALARAVRRR